MRAKTVLSFRAALPAFLLLLFGVVLFAAHVEGLFELGDGLGGPGAADIVGSDAQEGCDWDDLFDADPTPEEIAAAVAACGGVGGAFVADTLSQGGSKDETVFVKGSAKNDAPVASWSWADGSVPTKDDLSNVYTYATLNEFDELIIYAGVERLAPNGDSHIDFELNQLPVELDRDPPCGGDETAGPEDGAPCEFEGEKTEGDLLVTMDFEKGGSYGVTEIRRWDGFNYVLLEALSSEGCNAADSVCVFNNGIEIDGGAWPSYDSKGRVVSTLDENAFTEAGINVTALLDETPCFVSFLAKSRSSASYSSSLKDFVRTGFSICSLTIDKSGVPGVPELSKIGDEFTFLYTIENTGAGTLELVSIIDSHLGDITEYALQAGQQNSFLAGGGSCGTLDPKTSCSFEIDAAVPDDANDPFTTSVTATYRPKKKDALTKQADVVISVTDDDTFPLNLFQPSVSVTKEGDDLSTPGNTVSYTITIVNTGSDDSPPLVNGMITDTDPLLGDLFDPDNPYVTFSTCSTTLPTGDTCVIEAERVVLPDDPNPISNTVSVSYNPDGFTNVISGSDDHDVNLVYPGMSLSLTGAPVEADRGDTITYTFVIENLGDVDLNRISAIDTLLGDVTGAFPDILDPQAGPVTVVLQRVIQPDDPNPVINVITVVYQVEGLPNEIGRTASFSVELIVPCALSPGFWKGGSGVPKWNDILEDYIAQNAGFDTGTTFPWLDPSLAGSTYLNLLDLPATGDVTRQLAFKYIAARLNQATFGLAQSYTALLDAIDLYLMQHPVGSDPAGDAQAPGSALFNDINDYFSEVGEGRCPPPDAF
jgi:uncharacterized repeat protein (TIGR01451 family)